MSIRSQFLFGNSPHYRRPTKQNSSVVKFRADVFPLEEFRRGAIEASPQGRTCMRLDLQVGCAGGSLSTATEDGSPVVETPLPARLSPDSVLVGGTSYTAPDTTTPI